MKKIEMSNLLTGKSDANVGQVIRIWSENEVIDTISSDGPIIKEITR